MPQLIVATHEGESRAIECHIGQSLMEAVRDNGFDEMLALCGGCCSCATCHVYIGAAWQDRLPPMTADENDLLDSALDRRVGSRLSCQISITQALDGLCLTIAAED